MLISVLFKINKVKWYHRGDDIWLYSSNKILNDNKLREIWVFKFFTIGCYCKNINKLK